MNETNECLYRRLDEGQWRTAYIGDATSLPLRLLLQSPDDDDDDAAADDDDEYACRVTSQNNYGWGPPSDILTVNHNGDVTSDRYTTVTSQSQLGIYYDFCF